MSNAEGAGVPDKCRYAMTRGKRLADDMPAGAADGAEDEQACWPGQLPGRANASSTVPSVEADIG